MNHLAVERLSRQGTNWQLDNVCFNLRVGRWSPGLLLASKSNHSSLMFKWSIAVPQNLAAFSIFKPLVSGSQALTLVSSAKAWGDLWNDDLKWFHLWFELYIDLCSSRKSAVWSVCRFRADHSRPQEKNHAMCRSSVKASRHCVTRDLMVAARPAWGVPSCNANSFDILWHPMTSDICLRCWLVIFRRPLQVECRFGRRNII